MSALLIEMDVFLPRHLWSDLVGLPFKSRGRGPDEYDCFGLVMQIYRRRGIVIPDLYYGDNAEEHAKLLVQGAQSWRPCPVGAGAVCLWRSWSSTAPDHVGVMINQDQYIHATAAFGQVMVTAISRSPAHIFAGCFIPPDSYARTEPHAV